MALGSYEKIKIDGILKNNDVFYYEDFSLPRRKYIDDELIEYLLNTIIRVLSNDKEAKNKFLERCFLALYTIFDYCLATEREFSDDLARRTIALKSDYVEYLNRLKLPSNAQTERVLLDLVELLVNNRAFVDESILTPNNEAIVKEQEEISSEVTEDDCHSDNYQNETLYEELQRKIKDLENKLNSYEKDNEKKDSVIKELKGDVLKLNDQIQSYQRENAKKDKKRQELQELITEKEKKIENANATIVSLNAKIIDRESANKKATSEVIEAKKIQKDLNKVIKDQRSIIATYTSKEQRDLELQAIENDLILLISKKQLSIKEIMEELSYRGLVVTNEELQLLLTRIRNKISIEPSNKTIPRSYRIEKINYGKGKLDLDIKKFKLNANGEHMIKLLLLADSHSDIRDISSFEVYKIGYEYCLKNGIENIFLLGDVFDCSCRYNLETKDGFSNTLVYYKENIEKFLEIYPKCEEITNSFLGGNHEKMMLDVGISPVELIADERLDFVSLGYNDAIVEIENDKFMLHHPNRVLNLPKKRAALKYIRDFYKNNDQDKSNIYVDIFGHFHVNYLNQTYGYALISSLTRNENGANGASEIRIMLNDKGFINSIVFVPLVCNKNSLVSAGEIEYKKLMLK